MFFNPTMGTYQRRKMRKKRMTQVKTKQSNENSFCGLISNVILSEYCLTVRTLLKMTLLLDLKSNDWHLFLWDPEISS